MKTGDFEHTTSSLVTLWEIVRRDHDFRTFCDRNMIHFRNGFLGEEGHRLPETEQILQRFRLVAPIPHYTVRFRPGSILEAPLFNEPFLTKHIYISEGEEQGALAVTPLAGEGRILVDVPRSERTSLPQTIDEIAEWIRSAREVAGIRAGGPRTKGTRETPAVEVLDQDDERYHLQIDITANVSTKQIRAELRRLFGATKTKGKDRRRGARGSSMASMRFVTPETLTVFDMHAAGSGVRAIAKRMWPDEYERASLSPDEFDRRLDRVEAGLVARGLSRKAIDVRLDRIIQQWPTIERLEGRVFEKVATVRRCIAALEGNVLRAVTAQSSREIRTV